jgi:hypothetical protein
VSDRVLSAGLQQDVELAAVVIEFSFGGFLNIVMLLMLPHLLHLFEHFVCTGQFGFCSFCDELWYVGGLARRHFVKFVRSDDADETRDHPSRQHYEQDAPGANRGWDPLIAGVRRSCT